MMRSGQKHRSGERTVVENLSTALGAELTRLRTDRHWSQQQLAEMLGYDASYIGQIERAEKSPTLRTMIDFAYIFEVKLSALIRAAESKINRAGRV